MAEHHDTVVVGGGDGSNTGLLVGIVALIVALAIGWFLLFGNGTSNSTTPDINVNVPGYSNAPAAS